MIPTHTRLDGAHSRNRSRQKGVLRINEIGYAELAARMNSEGDLQHALTRLDVGFERTPTAALFVAGKTFGRYRAVGGTRPSLLPDFFIGVHADVAKLPFLTRDARRYRSYFPCVELIAPNA
ncbi:DNA-binding protein [Xanthobacteraceae bacterium Astr-EGSB]|uniref:type II toxin-antitoxin system VapC family toxin n=1 Tax=Astrobacterium formosum TaxID=3069710 RepID=UPI0027B0B119|nr:DNA-binding protein [Xanthobacteraceae bacterium Astr-EGSB]